MVRRIAARSGTTRCLVVMCHGVAGNSAFFAELGRDWAESVDDATFVLLDAPIVQAGSPTEDDLARREWFAFNQSDLVSMEMGAVGAARLLNAAIDEELARFKLPAGAVFLVGFSQGAMVALFAGLRRHPQPMGIIAYSGGLIASERLKLEQKGTPPMLIVHGRADEVVPCSWSEETAGLLARRGIAVTKLFIDGLGHTIDGRAATAGGQYLRSRLQQVAGG